MRQAAARLVAAGVIFDQRAIHSVAVALEISAKIAEQFLRVFLAATGMKFENHVAPRNARPPQATGGAFAFDLRVHHAHGRLVHLQIICGEQLGLHLPDHGLEPAGAVLDPVTEHLPGEVHPEPRELLFLPVERQVVVILGQHDLRDEAGAGATFFHRSGRQRRDAHLPLAARAGQLGAHDLVPDNLRRDVFEAFALFTTDLALGLPTVRAKFFRRLEAFGHRLQHAPGSACARAGAG